MMYSKSLVFLSIGFVFAASAESVRGVDAWTGIAPHPAVVNPVVRPADDRQTVSLRGEWDFISNKFHSWRRSIDAGDLFDGTSPRWVNEVRKIRVPGCWEAQGVGTSQTSRPWACIWDASPKPIRHAFWGEGWYRKRVKIPADWKGLRIWLKTGCIGNEGWLWVNGHEIAHVQLYCGTVKYDVTDHVKPDETATVVIQAVNTGTSRMGGIDSMNNWGGVLRDVELEATPSGCFIDDAWVRGDFDGRTAEVKVKVEGEQRNDNHVLRATIEGETREIDIHSSSSDFTLEVPLRDFRPWSPVHPNLYTAKVELVENGTVVQTRFERFGVRKLEVRGKEFFLNGKPFFVRGCGWHNIYPIEGTSPADRELYRKLARKIRDSGFNTCRFHTSCRPPELFEAADEVGLLLEPELPYYTDISTGNQPFDPSGDADELYRNYRRHPSFAIYSGGNEGWFGPELSAKLYEEIKARDPDRLMIGQDGWNNLRTNQRGMSDYQGGPMNVWPRGSFDPDSPFVCHEYLNLSVKFDTRLVDRFTGVWLPPTTRETRAKWLSRFGLDLSFGDRLQDAQAYMQKTWRKYGLESARLDPHCDGYSYWSLQDACSPNGEAYSGQALFDPFWGEKPHGDTVASVAKYNSESCLLLDTDPRLYGPEEEEARFSRDRFELYLTDFATNRIRCAGERIDACCYLAHYGECDFTKSMLRWRLVSGERTLAEGEADTGVQRVGAVREIARFSVSVPELSEACSAKLCVTLDAPEGTVANDWDWWLFPRRRRIDGSGIYVAEAFRPWLAHRFDNMSASADAAKVVIGPTNDPAVVTALARGRNVITLCGQEGETNVRLGWWWMGKQMGAVIADHPALKGLPHDGFLSPLLFRIMKDGVALTPDAHRDSLVVYGEGGEACYSYLAEKRHASGSAEMAVSGIDLLADLPESDAILRGLVSYLVEKAVGGLSR